MKTLVLSMLIVASLVASIASKSSMWQVVCAEWHDDNLHGCRRR